MLKHIPILGDFFVSKKLSNQAIAELRDRNIVLEKEASFYKEMNKILSDSQKRNKIITVVGFDDNEAEPIDAVARKEYVKEVDIFYDNILKKKLTTSIADIRELLSNIHVANGFPQNMQRDQYDYFLRGMEAFAWKINEWATTLQGERREVLQDKENQE
jgi:hypothetical protein